MSQATTPYAQTNVQLYQQLVQAGWPEDDVRHVQSAYRLALRVVAGHYHASERPFVAHLVGVGSILARHGAHATVVSAGILHSVYNQGDFGDGSSGVNESRRLAVRRAVGAASEELVARYATLAWDTGTLDELIRRGNQLSPVDDAVAWIKAADLLESGSQPPLGESAPLESHASLENAARLARALGHLDLATEVDALLAAQPTTADARLSTFLAAGHRSSFAVAPLSHAMRPAVRIAKLFRGFRLALVATAPVARWLT